MKDLGGGVVLDLGVYMLQLVQFIYKDPPTDIVCTGHLSKAGVDESISCALKYKDGRTATLSAHTRATMANKAEIIGTKGAIVVSTYSCSNCNNLLLSCTVDSSVLYMCAVCSWVTGEFGTTTLRD